MFRTTVAALAAAVLAACAGLPPAPDKPVSFAYEDTQDTPFGRAVAGQTRTGVFLCADGFSFVARQEDDRAWVFLPSQTLGLPRAGGRDRFSDGVVALVWEGDTARLEDPGGQVRRCRNAPGRAEWEDAKLRGVDFRAAGRKPAWFVEIGGRIVLGTGDGRYAFPRPAPETDPAGRTARYRTAGGGHMLVLELRGEPCDDPGTGERFEVRVLATLDGREFSGCGRALH